MEAPKDEARWNSLAILAFVALFIVCVFTLAARDAISGLYTLTFLDAVILAFATLRTAHLLSDDKIFEFARLWFMDKRSGTPVKPARGFRRVVCELLECLWCTGMWSALVVVTMYLLNPLSHFLVLILAFAGASSMLQLLSRRIASVL